jgi:uncharacterized protein DUF4154
MPVLTHTQPRRAATRRKRPFSARSNSGFSTRVIVRRTLGILALALAPVAGTSADTRARQARAEDLKAVFLLNFAQFVEWPTNAFPDETAPFVIGILGDTPFEKNLDAIVANETVANHKIVVRYYHDLRDITACQILFIAPSESAHMDRIFESLKGRNILTVGETDDFSARAGMIRFSVVQNKLHLGINLEAVQAAQLVISSKLLRLAEIVSAKQAE